MTKRVLTLLLFILVLRVSVKAQSSQETDSTQMAFLPALAFNTDLGFIGGGIASFYNYKDNTRPFYSYTNLSAIFSTKGLASVDILYDKPFVFGTNMRLKTNVFVSRFFQDPYYGVANYRVIEEDPPNGMPDFYQFKSFSVGFNSTLRIPLSINEKNQQLDALAILNLDYETPWDSKSDQLMTREQPRGFGGGRTFMIGSGLIWEGRDNEFNPTSGAYIETTLEIGNKLWGGTFNNLVIKHEMFHYFTFYLIKDITLANRFYAEHTSGETPYWKLAYAGDDETLRGYPSRRFLDDNVAILNNELRAWLVEFPSVDTKLGAVLFFDVGRTFSNGNTFDEITSDLKYTIGFAGTASLFTPDFIIRGDVGFSEEGTGVYITTGYMF
ncbi:MAG: BamA/TamA family outer membrane protein [Balneolaceae bacterium]|nr:BamA/TamA family outer membrane protein [Balneolaceae bacterium]MBO6547592.1 BamA/TamA family outer membrane protein [Balneolaceae bacterium]MBO6648103.1 BamA/TamA family outer membrane protein [Balneolaceae bacterium]